MDVAKHSNHSDYPGKIDRKIDFFDERIDEIWCCRDPSNKMVGKECVANGCIRKVLVRMKVLQ